jgi:hypothetical protein
MKVFIIWSGEKSRHVAKCLRKWIPDVIQRAEPWMSEKDIPAGARWRTEIQEVLKVAKFGIICLTETNPQEPWLLFETGALAKTVEDTYVCPYLIDLRREEIPEGPLAEFQAKVADKEGTFEVMRTLNEAMGKEGLTKEQLERSLGTWWGELEREIAKAPEEPEGRRVGVDSNEVLLEIRDGVRELARMMPSKIDRMFENQLLYELKEVPEEIRRRDREFMNMWEFLRGRQKGTREEEQKRPEGNKGEGGDKEAGEDGGVESP